jgi:hypothetical protein
MKVFEILDSYEQEQLMQKVLEKHGFRSYPCQFRSKVKKGETLGGLSVQVTFGTGTDDFYTMYIYYDDAADMWSVERHGERNKAFQHKQVETPQEVLAYLEQNKKGTK